MEATQYYVVLGLNLIAGVLWFGAALAALNGWRAFRQRADLAWVGAFGALAFANFLTALAAWNDAGGAAAMPPTTILYAEDVLSNQLRLSALTLIAALLAFYAFVQRRAL
jgi:hypothetical protein